MKSHFTIVREFAKRIYKLHSSKDFNRLDSWEKEEYDECISTILSEAPFNCPIYECGGTLKSKLRKLPKDFDGGDNYPDGYDGDERTPDMECTNCQAVYKFSGFKDERRKLK